MGINGLWDVIGDGEVWPLAAYAAKHFEQHKRPLRIAVDEACWRLTNLTPEQVQKIREGEPAANPVEKVILWRILRLLRLNVQLLFVNDGPRRPWKRDKRGGGLIDRELLRLTRKLLQQLKVPYHEAPGEAEAECAKLQALGVVDAVWSDDGDSLMFGCSKLIRQHKINGKIVKDYIRVYNAITLQEKYGLNPDSLVLFALLAGGDYNTKGLSGCGSHTTHQLTKQLDLVQALRNTSEATLPRWRTLLQETLLRLRKAIDVPVSFPEWRPLNYYRNPTVSSNEQLLDLRGLRHGWDKPVNQPELRIFLRERFHFTTREYIKHIAPIYVIRRLARADTSRREQHKELGIELKRTKKNKDVEDDANERPEAKIMFSPLPVVEIDLSERPPEEDWTKFAAKDGTPYDPTQAVECEILRCFLKHGLPDGALDYVQPAKRKRKATAEDESSPKSTPLKKRRISAEDGQSRKSSPTKKQKKKYDGKKTNDEGVNAAVDQGNGGSKDSQATPKKRGRPKKQAATSAETSASNGSSGDDERPPTLNVPVFRHPQALVDLRATIELDDDDEGSAALVEVGSDDPAALKSPIMSGNDFAGDTNRPTECIAARLVPGQTIPRNALRELRASMLLSSQAQGAPIAAKPKSPSNWPRQLDQHEVIDLT